MFVTLLIISAAFLNFLLIRWQRKVFISYVVTILAVNAGIFLYDNIGTEFIGPWTGLGHIIITVCALVGCYIGHSVHDYFKQKQ